MRRVLPVLVDRREALRTALLVSGTLAVTFAAAAQRLPGRAILLLLVAGLIARAATRQLHVATLVGVAIIIVLPIYYGRLLPGVTVAITPTVAVSLVLLPGALLLRHRLRVQLEDWAFVFFWGLLSLSFALNYNNAQANFLHVTLTLLLPYVTFRLLLLQPRVLPDVARVIVACGVLLSLVAIRERQGIPNPYFSLVRPAYQAVWARPDLRIGHVRAEASFGHPIAFGMFLGLAILLALALAQSSRATPLRLAYVGSVVLLSIALVDTLSRGALLAFGVAGILWSITQVPSLTFARFRAFFIALLAVTAVGGATAGTLGQLRDAATTDRGVANSTQHRLDIIDVVANPDQFTLLGRPVEVGSLAASVAASVGLVSIDDQYAKIFLESGFLTLAAFLLLALLTWREVLSRGRTALERAWALSFGAAFLNLFTVALLTQYAQIFFIGLAGLAAIRQLHSQPHLESEQQQVPTSTLIPAQAGSG